jgi:hypothetical protein
MKNKILTLLVSRFNCPHPIWKDKTIEEYISWLQVRLDLFHLYTLKSYKNLNTKPDKWILLVDKKKLYNNIEKKLCELLKGENYQLVQYKSNFRESLLEYLIDTYGINDFPEEIRTTRLDTDDLISRDFFDRINSVVLEEDTSQLLISFTGGANYDAETGLFYYSSYPNNPFITLCQKTSVPSEFKCVYDDMHTIMHKLVQKNFYIDSYTPMWCSVIHENNLANQMLKRSHRVRLATSEWYAYSSFGIEIKSIEGKNIIYRKILSTLHKIHNILRPKYHVKKVIFLIKNKVR